MVIGSVTFESTLTKNLGNYQSSKQTVSVTASPDELQLNEEFLAEAESLISVLMVRRLRASVEDLKKSDLPQEKVF